jgi:hypothetical protein
MVPKARALRHPVRGHPVRALCGVLALASTTVGCRDLDEWALAEHEAYCGSLVSAPLFQEGLLPEGTPPALRMRLDLDVQHLASRPGTLTTDDAARGLCSANGDPLFLEAPLRTIAEALHDPLSTATIGEGRDQNVFAYVESACGHSMIAVLSLMNGGGVEVRLLKPGPEPDADTPKTERPGFGLFVLERQRKVDCAF